MPRRQLAMVAMLVALAACAKDPFSASSLDGSVGDGGVAVQADAAVDASPGSRWACTSTLLAFPDGGAMTWQPNGGLQPDAPQSATWTETDPFPADCADLVPAEVPSARSWTGPDASAFQPICDYPVFDQSGNFSDYAFASHGVQRVFFPADGTSGGTLIAGQGQRENAFASNTIGFVIGSYTSAPEAPTCNYVQSIDSSGRPTFPASMIETEGQTSHGDTIRRIFPNPQGGFVQVKVVNQDLALQLRWVDDRFTPLGEWHTAAHWTQRVYWRVNVDQLGRALVLVFGYPPSFGPPPDPSTWSLVAQWMDASGPIKSSFTPPTPLFRSANSTLFADWGYFVPMPEGGFVAFQPQAYSSSGGVISPSGWYVHYASGQPADASIPQWLSQYDESLQLVAQGNAYAAVQSDPTTCARTIVLISSGGKACYTVPLQGSDLCGAAHFITPEGSVTLKDYCKFRWWPLLAHLRSP